MATLIGRDCWHVGGCLRHGKIVAHRLEEPAVVTIDCGPDGHVHVAASAVLLSPKAALHEAEEARDYWERKVAELRELDESLDAFFDEAGL